MFKMSFKELVVASTNGSVVCNDIVKLICLLLFAQSRFYLCAFVLNLARENMEGKSLLPNRFEGKFLQPTIWQLIKPF